MIINNNFNNKENNFFQIIISDLKIKKLGQLC